MDPKIINAIESVERLRAQFEALFVLSDAVKEGVLADQTRAERLMQLKGLEKELNQAKADKAETLAELVRQKKLADDEVFTAKAQATNLLANAQDKVKKLLEAAEAGVAEQTRSAAAQRQAEIENHAQLMAGKQAMLADLDRQVVGASERLADLTQQHDVIEKKVSALKAAAAKVLG